MVTTRTPAIVAAIGAALLLSSCNAGADSDDTADNSSGGPAQSESVTIGLVAEPASLDFTTTDGAAIPQAMLDNIYETLVTTDQDGEIVGALASEWSVSDDGLTYVFTLVNDATFSNGETFTADDAVFSIERVQSDAWTVSLKAQMDVVESAEATGEHELTVTLKQPSSSWLFAMTTRVGAMFDEGGVDNLANDPIGTGPYVFETWKRGTSLTLAANPDYWSDQPFFGEVTLQYFTDANALNNAMLTDSIDVVGTVQAPESLTEFEGGDYQIIEGTTNGEVVLSMNNAAPPFDDVSVRKAVRYAIDNQRLMDTCWAGRGTLIGSMVPPTDPWYEDRTGDYPFDLDQAKQLLADAGAEAAKVRLRVPTLPYAVACGTVVESMLEDAGFAVTVEELEFPATWLEEVFTAKDYEMSIVAHVEPRDLGNVFGNPDYYTNYGTSELAELLETADTGTPEEQVASMKQAAELISRDAAAEFLFLLPNLLVADPDITGLPENAIGEAFRLADLERG